MALTASKQKAEIVILGTDKTKAAFKSAGRGLDTMQNKFTGMKLAGLGAAAALAALTAGLVLMTKRSIENADAIGKTADAIGIGVEQLQEYRHAAELSGIETEKFDASLVQFTKRVGEAGANTGSLVEFLNKYDKTLIDNISTARNTGEALDEVFRIMGDMESQTDRAALAAAAFGRSGVVMTNMLRDGTAGLQEMRDEAQRLGLVLNDDMIRQAEAANDAWLRMEKVVGVNLQKIFVSFAPVVEDVATAFVELAPEIQRAAEALASFILGVDIASIQSLELELGEVNEKLKEIALTVTGSPDLFEQLGPVKRLKEERAEIQATIEARKALLEQRRAEIEDSFNNPAANDNTGDAKIAKTIENERKRAEALLTAINETNLQVLGLDEQLLEQRHNQELEKLFELLEAGRITTEEFRLASAESQATFEQEQHELRLENLDTRLAEENELRLAAMSDLEIEIENHLDRIKRIEENSAMRNLAIWESGMQGKLQITKGVLGDIAGLMESRSRKMFAIGKAAAIGETIISTYLSAQRSYEAFSWFPPLGAAMAAISLAAGFARVQAIQSQTFGGGGGTSGGGGGSVGGGGNLPRPEPPDVPALAPPDTAPLPTTIFIEIDSDATMVSTEWLRDNFIPGLNEAIGDGTEIVAT